MLEGFQEKLDPEAVLSFAKGRPAPDEKEWSSKGRKRKKNVEVKTPGGI